MIDKATMLKRHSWDDEPHQRKHQCESPRKDVGAPSLRSVEDSRNAIDTHCGDFDPSAQPTSIIANTDVDSAVDIAVEIVPSTEGVGS
jgi:hypothetical protein